MKKVFVGLAFTGLLMGDFAYGMKKESFEDKLIKAVSDDDCKKVNTLAEENQKSFFEKVCNDKFLLKHIVPFLSDDTFVEEKNVGTRRRGLASYLLFSIYKQDLVKPSKEIFDAWAKAALSKDLKYNFETSESACNSTIKVMGDHDISDKCAMGFAYAISDVGTVSKPLSRDLLDEHYFIIAGNIEVALKQKSEKKWKISKGTIGDAIVIPAQYHVQFKNAGKEKLIMLVPTDPPYNQIGKLTNYNVETYMKEEDGYWDKDGKVIGEKQD